MSSRHSAFPTIDTIRSVVVTSSPYKADAHPVAHKIAEACGALGLVVRLDLNGELTHEQELPPPDLIIVVGGDGTILSAARRLARYRSPTLGVDVGQVGFLARHTCEQVLQYLDGQPQSWTIQPHMMLEAVIHGASPPTRYALNDLIIAQGIRSQMLQLKMLVDDELAAVFRLEGLVVSTPVGSTSYSLSTGGIVVGHEVRAMTIVPIAPFGLACKPIIVGGQREVRLVIASSVDELGVVLDGQDKSMLREGDSVLLRAAPFDFLLADSHSSTYFELLRRKIGWCNGGQAPLD